MHQPADQRAQRRTTGDSSNTGNKAHCNDVQAGERDFTTEVEQSTRAKAAAGPPRTLMIMVLLADRSEPLGTRLSSRRSTSDRRRARWPAGRARSRSHCRTTVAYASFASLRAKKVMMLGHLTASDRRREAVA